MFRLQPKMTGSGSETLVRAEGWEPVPPKKMPASNWFMAETSRIKNITD